MTTRAPMRFVELWRHRHLRRDTVLLWTVQIFYRLSGVVMLGVLSRRLSGDDIGIYFFALSFAESLTIFASFSLNLVLLRRVAADPEQASHYFACLLGFRLLSSPLYLLCVTVAAITLKGSIWLVIVAVACFTLLENLSFAFNHLFLALRKVSYTAAIGLAIQALFLAIFLIGMWWQPSLDVLVGANLLRALGLLGLSAWVAQRWLCPLRLAWDSRFVKEGLPFFLLALLTSGRGNLDTVLLGFFADYETVGQYQLAFRIIFTSFFIPLTIGQVIFPQLAAHGLSAANRRLLARVTGYVLGLGLLGMVGVFLCARPLTHALYGAQGSLSAPLLRPLALLLPLSYLFLFWSSALQALHQETKVLSALAVGLAINVLINWLWIPSFGAYAAVFAQVFSAVVELSILAGYGWRLYTQPEP